MNLNDLIEQLQELREEHGDDVEVRLAIQPHWPLEHSIDNVGAAEDDDARIVVYIGEGTQHGYLSGAAATALGWTR